jgi:hypothetical protein
MLQFDDCGLLPPGIHLVSWAEFVGFFGTSAHRLRLVAGLHRGLQALKLAGCRTVFVDGSFVTAKEVPGDFDCCWDGSGVDALMLYAIDPVFFDFRNKRAAQKAAFGGEFFPAQGKETLTGKTWLEFFQIDKETGVAKGVIAIDVQAIVP